MKYGERGRTYADQWFDSHFAANPNKGETVNVEAYYRRAESNDDEPWRRLAKAAFSGQVWSRPTADGGGLEQAVAEGITVLPEKPQPKDDVYASGHPLSISRAETSVTLGGTTFLLRHTVEVVDAGRPMAEVPSEVPVHLELPPAVVEELVALEPTTV